MVFRNVSLIIRSSSVVFFSFHFYLIISVLSMHLKVLDKKKIRNNLTGSVILTTMCMGLISWYALILPLLWRHNDHDGVWNHQPHGCLLNRLFRRRSKKTSKLRVTGLCAGNSPGPVNSPHKGPVTRKMFPFDDVIMVKPLPEATTHFQLTNIHDISVKNNKFDSRICRL